jgi:hypothetical protein
MADLLERVIVKANEIIAAQDNERLNRIKAERAGKMSLVHSAWTLGENQNFRGAA